MKPWTCRYLENGIQYEHLATGSAYANKSTGCMECEKHAEYLK